MITEEMLKELPVNSVSTYLQSQGWHERSQLPNGDRVFALDLGEDKRISVLVPTSDSPDDYDDIISAILDKLQLVERRSQEEIYKAIQLSDLDLVRIRSIHPQAEDGSIPLTDGLRLFQSTYNLLIAAATVVDHKQAYLPNRKPNEAMQYVQQVKIGQTERGSYVVVVHSSLGQDTPLNTPTKSDAPFGRRVLQTLADALTSLQRMTENIDHHTAGEKNIEDNIDSFINSGGSIDLCQAVEELNKSAQEKQVEISFSWSSQYPIEQQYVQPIVIDSEMAELSERLGLIIRRRWIAEEKSIKGIVNRLRRGGDDYVASVSIEGEIDGRHRTVRLEIRNEQDHKLVIRAYESRKQVSCRGYLVKRGNYTLFDRYFDLKMTEE